MNQEVINCGNRLYAISRTEEDPFNICYSVADGNGLEAMRWLMKRYEPRTPGTKRALLKAVINNLLMHVASNLREEDFPKTFASPSFLTRLEHGTKDMSYKEVRDGIMAYAERKRGLFGSIC